MCGIFGFNFDDKELLRRMGSVLKHRGPDGSGYYSDMKISLGHRRLKIIDLSERAKQPMPNEDSSIWLTYNGEIYNFKELKEELEKKRHDFISSTDSEVIIHAYEEFSFSFVKKLRGMFAFALYDSNRDLLILVRDRIGIKPLYYFFDGEDFIFASEIKAILKHVKPGPDFTAVDQFFTYQFPIGPNTMFEGIKKVNPGEMLIYNLKTKILKKEKYWELKLEFGKESEGFYIRKIEELLKESIKMRLRSDVPLGLYLSGGLDSGYIAALASELNPEIKTFTIGFNHASDETDYAEKTAEHLGLEHKEIMVEPGEKELLPGITWHLDMPVANVAAVPTYIMAQNSKKYLTVALTGDGGDEIFAGYDKYKLMVLRQKLKFLPHFLKKIGVKAASIKLKPETSGRLEEFLLGDEIDAYRAYSSSFTENEKNELYKGIRARNQRENLTRYFHPDMPLLQKLLNLDIKTLLPDDYLMKVDKMTMASAVEARVPLLDHRIVEFAMSIPPSLKIRGTKTKYIFRKAMGKKLPQEIINRKKHGFNLPTADWLENGLEEIAIQMFDLGNPLINTDCCRAIVSKFKTNPRYYSRQFWSSFSFFLWYKMYFEMERPSFNLNDYLS